MGSRRRRPSPSVRLSRSPSPKVRLHGLPWMPRTHIGRQKRVQQPGTHSCACSDSLPLCSVLRGLAWLRIRVRMIPVFSSCKGALHQRRCGWWRGPSVLATPLCGSDLRLGRRLPHIRGAARMTADARMRPPSLAVPPCVSALWLGCSTSAAQSAWWWRRACGRSPWPCRCV